MEAKREGLKSHIVSIRVPCLHGINGPFPFLVVVIAVW